MRLARCGQMSSNATLDIQAQPSIFVAQITGPQKSTSHRKKVSGFALDRTLDK